jgi:sugar lactone lactonase YvrE
MNANLLFKVCEKVTLYAFGCPSLYQLYITAASAEMGDKELTAYPLSGSLFVAKQNIKGIPANYLTY